MSQIFFSFTYLYYSSLHLYKSYWFLAIIIILEFFSLHACIIKSSMHVFHYASSSTGHDTTTIIDEIYSITSILPQFKNIMTCSMIDNQREKCSFTYYPLISIIGLFIFLIIVILLLSRPILKNNLMKEKDKDKSRYYDSFNVIAYRLFFNFFDYCFFRISNLITLFVITNYMIHSIHSSQSIPLMLVSFIIVGVYIFLNSLYINTIFVYTQIGNNYPFDSFSRQYDSLILFLKLVFSIEANLEIQTNTIQKYNIYSVFFSCIGIIAIIIFLWYHLSKFLLIESHIIYYSNEKCNLLRFGLLIYTVMLVIFFIFIHANNGAVILITINITFAALTVVIMFLIKWHRLTKIYRGKAINQIFFLIDHYSLLKHNSTDSIYSSPDYIKLNQNIIRDFYRNMYIYHLTQCANLKNTCSLCKLFEDNNIDNYDLFITQLLKCLYDKFKATHNDSGWEVEAIEFIHQILEIKENYFLFSYYIVNLLNKLQKTTYFALSINILAYYKQKLNKLEQSIIKVNMILSIEEQSSITNEILDEWKSTLFIKVQNPYNLINSALNLNRLWKRVIKIINTNQNQNNYHSFLIKFILEKIFKKKLKHGGVLFDIASYEERINECYLNDNHLALSMDLTTKRIYLLSSGKEFASYKNKDFKDIFLTHYEDIGLHEFKQNIKLSIEKKEEYKEFQFPIKDLDHQGYLQSFRIRYIVLPTINLKDCLIFGSYLIKRENLIVTKVNQKTKEEQLLNYSFNLKNFLIFPMELMDVLTKNKFSIDLSSVLVVESEKSTISLNKRKYSPFLSNIINKLSSVHDTNSINRTEILKIYSDLKETIELKKHKTKEIKLKSKTIFNYSRYNYILNLYSLQKDRSNNTTYHKDDYQLEHNDSLIFSNFLQLNTSTLGTAHLAEYSSAMNSSYLDNSQRSIAKQKTKSSLIFRNYRLKEEYREKKRQSRNFRIFTFFILGFNVILILLTIVFLCIYIDRNYKFTTMLDFFLIWSQLMRTFFNSTLNIFFNMCIGIPKETTCYNSFVDYGKLFNYNHGLPLDFSIQTYFMNELVVKVDILRRYSNNVSTKIYSLNEESIISVIESDFKFRYLSVVDEKLKIKQDIYNFMNAINIFLNLINMIIENDDYLTKPLYILKIYGPGIDDIILDSINLDAPLTQGQITGYNIVLNFPIYISTFFSLNEIVYKLLLRNIANCKTVVISFSVVIIQLHFILMILCFWFSYFFKYNLDNQVRKVICKLKDKLIKSILKEKYTRLKQLAAFYQENPTNMITLFNKQESKKLKEMVEKSTLNIITQPEIKQNKRRKQLHYPSKSYKAILRKPLSLLFSIFSLYFTYSIIFLVLLLYFLSSFSLLINILSHNVTLDTYLASLIGLTQVTLMTNQTEQELADYLNQTVIDMSDGFSQTFISESYLSLFIIVIEEQKNLIPLVESVDCIDLYDTIKDEILIQVNSKFSNFDYSKIIPNICNSYPFMKERSPKIIITEVLYRSTQILKSIEYSYESLYEVYNSYDWFDLYIIMLIIFRPIRTYETITLFIEGITSISSSNNWISYVYLCCNIVIELLLFIAIRQYVIKKYNLINKSMNQLIHSINE